MLGQAFILCRFLDILFDFDQFHFYLGNDYFDLYDLVDDFEFAISNA